MQQGSRLEALLIVLEYRLQIAFLLLEITSQLCTSASVSSETEQKYFKSILSFPRFFCQ